MIIFRTLLKALEADQTSVGSPVQLIATRAALLF